MPKRLELLAPAGDWDSMVAAVQNGADAVYLGGRMCNARQYAGNFGDEALYNAIAYCHARDARVYVALNTLLLDKELNAILQYAAFLYQAGVDALIVQDLGLTRMLRSAFQELPLHASTQMCIHNLDGLLLCEQLGLKRAILARECSLSIMKALSQVTTGIELECFAHGALCTAVSGMCLFSSLAGGRSGNRGACAQPCRKRYAADGGEFDYPLSLEDLNMLFHVDELRDAGVQCIKLEGRMKSPEYVAGMTRAYRKAIDGASRSVLQTEWENMRHMFFRGNSTGYYFGKQVPAGVEAGQRGDEHMQAVMRKEREAFSAENRKRRVDGKLILRVGQQAELTFVAGKECVKAVGNIVEEAKNEPNPQKMQAQIAKLGGTPFMLGDLDVYMPQPAFVSTASLNAMRRDASAAMLEALAKRREPIDVPNAPALPKGAGSASKRIGAIVPNVSLGVHAFQAGADIVILSPRSSLTMAEDVAALQACRKNDKKLFLELPAVLFDERARKQIFALFESGMLDGGVAQNASQAAIIKGERIAGYLCNAANAQTVAQLIDLGFDAVLLSLELNKGQMKYIMEAFPSQTGILAYGRAQLMQLWHCPTKSYTDCGDCAGKRRRLQDEAGRAFVLDPLYYADGCLNRLRNCEVMDVLDGLSELPKPELLLLEFVLEDHEVAVERILAARAALAGGGEVKRVGSTRGHWARGWQSH